MNKDFGLSAMVGIGIAAQCYFTSMIPLSYRKRAFPQEWLQSHFEEEHLKSTGVKKLPSDGYPDMGNGRYSDKLTYKQWFDLNNAYRIHTNYIEQVGSMVPATLVAGIIYPRASAIIGTAGHDSIKFGAQLVHGAFMAQLILGIASGFRIYKPM